MSYMMQPYGMQSMLKEGHKYMSGLDEAVLKNIDACKQLSKITRTSLGPNGMNKMIINHLEKLFVTTDAGTMINELEVQHPAAKLLVLAARAQQEEVGDGVNFVVSFAGELLQGAEELIRNGLHPSEIITGYAKALGTSLEVLDSIVEPNTADVDVRNKDEVLKRMSSVVASKVYGQEEALCKLIADACIQVCPKNPLNFNVDNVRVAKLVGGGVGDSSVVAGMVLKNDAVGSIKHAYKAKIAVFGAGIDTSATETKGTVLIQSAAQLESYSSTEEARIESLIRDVAESGATIVVSGAGVGEMALHFCERYKLMVIKISSKFELRRFCRTTGSIAQVKLQRPAADELGYADSVSVEEIGGTRCTIIKNESGGNSLATVVLRGSTDSILDDFERAVDDGVNAFKAMCKDSRLVPGAGASEIELAYRLKEVGSKETGLNQYAILKFAECLEVVARILSENAGLNSLDVLSALYSAHAGGNRKAGVDIEEGKDLIRDDVWDQYITKFWALKLSTDAVCTVLRVDQIIMAKQAGGPKPGQGGGDED
jgi:T-complex protein 1 subunit theta